MNASCAGLCGRMGSVFLVALAMARAVGASAPDPLPPMDLPPGVKASVAAGPPLVKHPIMASLGGPGQLLVGDAAGTNLNKAGLERELPNRIVLLRDRDGDGVYDVATTFADRMTFPQGGVWLDGSFYVASPPGIWRLTDGDGDGVADRREMLVGGFEFTGNAADVHGPFLHPNGRLYWCHGRKGHQVSQRDGTLVHAGLASGIWSCRPDGSEVRWHALACADNPAEIDFTPSGEILGTVNLYYSEPRGDTLIHWLRGGVYPREDMLEAIVGLPRTIDVMPVAHLFGHVAISGCAFYRSGVLNPGWRGNLFAVHFNTQRVTRMELEADGAGFRATSREFLKVHAPDAHLTDVLEDRDGSLLVVDTGGWFRIGCPSSLMAKPEVAGAVYRLRAERAVSPVEPWGAAASTLWALARRGGSDAREALLGALGGSDPELARAAGNALASFWDPGAEGAVTVALGHGDAGVRLAAAHALGEAPVLGEAAVAGLMRRLGLETDASVEHQLMFGLLRHGRPAALLEAVRDGGRPVLQRRALVMLDQMPGSGLGFADVVPLMDSPVEEVGRAAAGVMSRHGDWMPEAGRRWETLLREGGIREELVGRWESAVRPWMREGAVRGLVTVLLTSSKPGCRDAAWRLLASAGPDSIEPGSGWTEALERALTTVPASGLHGLLDAIVAVKSGDLRPALERLSRDASKPVGLRLKAMGAALRPGSAMPEASFGLIRTVMNDPGMVAARPVGARLLATARLSREQQLAVAGWLGPLGPLELRELVRMIPEVRDVEVGRAFAGALARAVSLGAFQESELRTDFAHLPPDCYGMLAPAFRELDREEAERRRRLEVLPEQVVSQGRAAEGRRIFERGDGACSACHRIGSVGARVGPDLSTIGRIRTERDLCESILFPSATLARDHETYVVELAQGGSVVGVIRRKMPDTVVMADASAQERTIPRSQIVSMQALPVSLMPAGLDRVLSAEQLLDVVAYLRSCR